MLLVTATCLPVLQSKMWNSVQESWRSTCNTCNLQVFVFYNLYFTRLVQTTECVMQDCAFTMRIITPVRECRPAALRWLNYFTLLYTNLICPLSGKDFNPNFDNFRCLMSYYEYILVQLLYSLKSNKMSKCIFVSIKIPKTVLFAGLLSFSWPNPWGFCKLETQCVLRSLLTSFIHLVCVGLYISTVI